MKTELEVDWIPILYRLK